LWLGLLGLQFAWIAATVGSGSGYAANAVAYHHAPAFAAYFMGGCLIGQHRRLNSNAAGPGFATGTAAILGGFALMLWLNAQDAVAVLTGWRGVLLTGLSFLLVALAGSLKDPSRELARFAVGLGNATYGLYLIHPVIFFGLSFAVLPRLGVTQVVTEWPMAWRLLFSALVLAGAFVLALISEHGFEQPLRRRLSRFFDRRSIFKRA
jgi:peptidoglycan/LPS O-acetylase OafA/YrhL